MNRIRLLLLAFTCALGLGLPHPATAGGYRPIRPVRPIVPSQPIRPIQPVVPPQPIRPVGPVVPSPMPGWDWWRIYPWSPYNYGRNPYNPIIYPYPYPYVPYYGSYSPSYAGGPTATP
jgi:hypothetical protein